jgi:DNA-binding SARP family transcriptional activator
MAAAKKHALMEFKILGPLEVHEGERLLALAGQKQRLLLGVLLLHANEVVSSDQLIDALWGASPPETARKALQMHVSQLRDLLEPRRARGEGRILRTRPPGYELRLKDGELDLHRFEQAVAEARAAANAGRADEAALGLRDALALWRGPPLADLSFESSLQADIARLEELRIAALEDRIDADIVLGRHADVVAELEGLAAQHPRRERVRAQLMLALYRSGRQAEALEVYRDTRRVLVDELGIEPGKELRELEDAILRQDPVLDQGPTVDGVALQQSRSTFVGRQRELEILRSGLENSFAGRGGLYLLTGEPGIGKSRLAEELANDARSRRAQVLVGRCWEAGGAPAYWPWIQSLRAYVQETEREALRAQLDTGAGDLAELLPELREFFPDLPQPAALESEGARVRLFDAATSFLKRAASSRPLVLIIDDLHSADEPSLLLLQFLTRELPDSRVLVIAALRDVDPTIREPLAPTLAELAREPATHQISLAGLSGTDVADYIELAASSPPPPQLVETIYHETEGNPLFVTEVVRLLDTEGRLSELDFDVRIPASVRAVIEERLRRLPRRCHDVLVLASVLGREFGLEAIGCLSQLPQDELLATLDDAMAERVVGEVPGIPGQLRFGHALIRDTLYSGLTPARRLQLHRRAGEALESVYAGHLDPHLAELAHHFVAAAGTGAAEEAIRYASRAGDRAASQLAYEEAARLYEMALELVDEAEARSGLLVSLGDAQARAGNTPASKRTFREAARLAEDLGLSERLAHAALGYGGRILWEVQRDDEYLATLLERALAALAPEDSTLRVRLLARLAGGPLRDARFPPERRFALSREALEMARRIGDRPTLAYALDAYIVATETPDNTEEHLLLAAEQLEVATEEGDQERVLEAHEHRQERFVELGDMPNARAEIEAMMRVAEELRQPAQRWLAGVCASRDALLEGRLDEAEAVIAETRDLGERALEWNAAVAFRLQLFILRREQGRLDEVVDLVRRSVKEYPTYPIWGCILAQTTAALGLKSESERSFEGLAADRFAGIPFTADAWLVSLGFLAESAKSLADAERASVIYELLLPYADRVAVAYPEIATGAVSRYLGILAATRQRWTDGERHFAAALELNDRIGARPSVAHCQLDYAEMLLARNGGDDFDRAGELLACAIANYRELGMDKWAARAVALVDSRAQRAPPDQLPSTRRAPS